MTTVFGAPAQCPCRVLPHTYSGPVVSCTNYSPGAVPHPLWSRCCPHPFWPWCCPHPFWPGAVHTHSGPVLPAPILVRCCPHQFWPGAVCTHSGLMQPAPTPAKCSPHLSLPSAASTWLHEGELMLVMTSSSGVPRHAPPIP